MMLAFRLARRDLRLGVRGLRIVLACLALGVMAIAAVGSLRAGVSRGLAEDGSRILGGDIEVQTGAEATPPALLEWLRGRGDRVSEIVTMRSMLIAESGERALVELKSVDGAWPLVGRAGFDQKLELVAGSIVVEPLVGERLGLKRGSVVRLGSATLTVAGFITEEPDRVATPSIFGPRALIVAADLPATGLIQPGAIVEHLVRIVVPDGRAALDEIAALRSAFPGQGWRIRDSRRAAPQVAQFLDRTSLFLTLVGLTSLLVGGIGVANGTHAWIEAKQRSIAILRCLGASSRLIFAVSFIQVMALAGVGIVIGLIGGAVLPILASSLLKDALPVPPAVHIYPAPLAYAALYGVLTAGCFALWPLSRSMRIPGAALFRDMQIQADYRPGAGLIAVNVLIAAALIALTIFTAEEKFFALWFCIGAIATLLLFRAGGWAMMRVASRLRVGRVFWLQLGVGNVWRPGSAAALMLVSLGIGLSTLSTVTLIQGNLRHQVFAQLPERAPSFFFVDIQNSQMEKFREIVASVPGTTDLREVPSLRARVVAVNGVPADQVQATPDTAWALRGDRGLTYAAVPPEGARLVEGAWWQADYSGPPLVSFDANLARGWNVRLGDIIRVNVLGRDIDLKVASLRDVAWRTLGINFTMVASPGLLQRAPHTHIATVRAAPGTENRLLREVTDALPNVSGVRVADVLAAIASLLNKIAAALAATGSVTLAAGALVLAGAVAAGQASRVRQAVILKSLGATRGQIRGAWLVEFGFIGLTAGIIASAVGTAASYGVVRFVMGLEWILMPGTLAATILFCIALMLVFGYAATASALRSKPAPLLRNE